MTTHEARRVETYLRLQAEAALRQARADELHVADTPKPAAAALVASTVRKSYGPRRSPDGSPPSGRSWLLWLASQAWALADVGIVDEATAACVIRDLSEALAARGALDDFDLSGRRGGWIPPARDSSPPAGPMRVVQVGAAVDGELQGQPFSVRLGTMVLDPDGAILTMTASLPAVFAPQGPGGRLRTMVHALRHSPATDDKGASYELGFSGGGSDEHWEGTFRLRPAPPEDARWLDITLPGAAPLRVFLDPAPAAATSTKELPASEAAERYLDGLALQELHDACTGDRRSRRDLAGALSGLLGAGALAADSPALARLGAVTSRVRPAKAPHHVPPEVLPDDWECVLRRRRARNGPVGVIPFAAVLPEVDGACCAVLRIASERDAATIDVYARGWPWRHSLMPGVDDGAFFWTARDDLGGFYVASSEGGSRSSHGEAELALDFRPAINPRARELQIILTGKTGEVAVTVPLNWQEKR